MPQTDAQQHLEALRTRRDILELLWRRGLSGNALISEHTKLIDSHLLQNFSTSPGAASGMALIAVGGYGRGELFPFSDIDLLLLHAPGTEDRLNDVAEAIFYPLWDAGLEVGHSVRTVAACMEDARQDFFFQVALIDARLIAGEERLFRELQAAYRREFVEGRRLEFLEQMQAHREERLRRFGKHSYMLEPHIKEGRGGMRDVQALLWTAKVVFGLKSLNDLRDAGLLSLGEEKAFAKAWNGLSRIRNRLHYLSGRKNDQLFFEHQEEIAKAFKYRTTKGIRAVEHFMRDVYGYLRVVAGTTDLFFEHADEVLNRPRTADDSDDLTEHEPGIISHNRRLRVTPLEEVERRPELMLRVFAHAAETGLRVHHQTKKRISANLHLIDANFQASPANGKTFLSILTADTPASTALEEMLDCGLLGAYIPEFVHLQALAQHDVYHVYTVDHHLIQTVAALHRLKKEHHNIFPLIEHPHVLFLAGLCHDLGKGYGADHSLKGEKLAGEVGARLGLKAQEKELLQFAVRHHLFLTDTALRRDLEDPGLIRDCAAMFESREQLAMLYLIAIADAQSTGPTVWNDWKAALLLDLYLKIALLIDEGEEGHDDLVSGLEWIKEKTAALFDGNCPVAIDELPEDYLLSFSPEEIAAHIRLGRETARDDIKVIPKERDNAWNLLLITHDKPGLLTKICGTITLHGMELLSAQVYTWPDGTAVDSVDVRSLFGREYESQDWAHFKDDLKKAINNRLGLDYRLSRQTFPKRKAPPREQQLPPKVEISNSASEQFTLIEVFAENRPGLLYRIARVLTDFQINIFRAKIGTRSDQVVDVFYVLDSDGHKIRHQEFVEEIRQSLLFAAEGNG